MVHEYKQQIEILNRSIDMLSAQRKETEKKLNRAVDQANDATDKLGVIADIISGITEHNEAGDIIVYLSSIKPEGESKLKRLFRLLDIPMTAEQIKAGDTVDED